MRSAILITCVVSPLILLHALMATDTNVGHFAAGWYTQHLAGDKWDADTLDVLLPGISLGFGLARIWRPRGHRIALVAIAATAFTLALLPVYYHVSKQNIWWWSCHREGIWRCARLGMYYLFTSSVASAFGAVAGYPRSIEGSLPPRNPAT